MITVVPGRLLPDLEAFDPPPAVRRSGDFSVLNTYTVLVPANEAF
ncbi:MAG: hypothetical protein ACOY9B_06560 [Pseudomonadota bacterium]